MREVEPRDIKASIRVSVSGSREAGPMVATIFVRRMKAAR
jgi:hypothetical protein